MDDQKLTGDASQLDPEPKAFTTLFLEHQDQLYSYILAMVLNQTDADDLLQETALVMHNKFEDFQPDSNFLAWGMTIARNKTMNLHQKLKTNAKFKEETVQRLSQRLEQLTQQSVSDHRSQALQECMSKLEPRDKELMEMRYEEDLKVPEISEKLNRTAKALYQAFYRITRGLRLCVENVMARKKKI